MSNDSDGALLIAKSTQPKHSSRPLGACRVKCNFIPIGKVATRASSIVAALYLPQTTA